MNSRMFRTTAVLSVIVFLSLILPVSIAGFSSTASVSGNTVNMEEYVSNADVEITVPNSQTSPYEQGSYTYVTEDGHTGYKMVYDNTGDENFTPDHKSLNVDIEIGEDVYFCFYVYKPIIKHPNYENNNQSEQAKLIVTFQVDGVEYTINDNSESGYYSIHHTEADGTTLSPMPDINQVEFMAFDDSVTFNASATRSKIHGNETPLEFHVIFL